VTEVRVGTDAWTGPSPDEAVDIARKSLGERLADIVRRAEEARLAIMGDAA
jgi:hypothetical protein